MQAPSHLLPLPESVAEALDLEGDRGGTACLNLLGVLVVRPPAREHRRVEHIRKGADAAIVLGKVADAEGGEDGARLALERVGGLFL